MKREFIVYGTAPDGTVAFVGDASGRVQLLDADRAKREVSRRMCYLQQVGLVGDKYQDRTHFCYWTKWTGEVTFAFNVNGNVQLYSEKDAFSHAAAHHCLVAELGFIGVDRDGTPLGETK